MNKMTPAHTDSPLRRSEAGIMRAPVGTPFVNDDEAERRASRARASMLDTSTTSSVLAHTEGLDNCLQIFNENKINKDNAWTMSLIDHFSALVKRHHNFTKQRSFQIVGSTLEASSKIYGLRVDSVHTDVLHIVNGLTRLKVPEKSNQGEGEDMGDEPSQDHQEAGPSKTRKKPKRRGANSNIVKNKESLNAKLDTYVISEPTFAKLNSVIGDINSSHRLLTYVLPTVNSELIHRTTVPYWDHTDHEPIQIDPNDEYDYASMDLLGFDTKLQIDETCLLRPQHSGYRISDTPAEEESKDDTADRSFDASQLDVAFDINAEVEPIADVPDFMDTGLDAGDYDALTEDDMKAINACKGLRRTVTILEDMRPLDSTSEHLEYSYRALDNIDQFWAGPSHWKFRKSRATIAASAGHPSISGSSSVAVTVKKKPLRRKHEPIVMVDFDASAFVPLKQMSAKLKKINIYKRWDPKKLRLPTDHKLERNRYNQYHLAPGIPIQWRNEPQLTQEIPVGGYNYDNAEDREYCSNIHADDDDTDRSTVGGGDNIPESADIQPANVTVAEIGTEFIGAPEKVVKIDIPFAKRAKVIDMTQLKRCCMAIVTKQCTETKNKISLPSASQTFDEEYKEGLATFKKIYTTLPALLSHNMKEALSPAVAFYSILHLANEYELRLTNVEGECDEDDFQIRQIVHKNDK